MNDGQFREQALKDKRKRDNTYCKLSISVKINEITREGNLEILIKYYRNQC